MGNLPLLHPPPPHTKKYNLYTINATHAMQPRTMQPRTMQPRAINAVPCNAALTCNAAPTCNAALCNAASCNTPLGSMAFGFDHTLKIFGHADC